MFGDRKSHRLQPDRRGHRVATIRPTVSWFFRGDANRCRPFSHEWS